MRLPQALRLGLPVLLPRLHRCKHLEIEHPVHQLVDGAGWHHRLKLLQAGQHVPDHIPRGRQVPRQAALPQNDVGEIGSIRIHPPLQEEPLQGLSHTRAAAPAGQQLLPRLFECAHRGGPHRANPARRAVKPVGSFLQQAALHGPGHRIELLQEQGERLLPRLGGQGRRVQRYERIALLELHQVHRVQADHVAHIDVMRATHEADSLAAVPKVRRLQQPQG
mmetsp:Transcript_5188/g.18985  ORF Transcript_5188/g.18985 Transcript_5188/m.18985 type:complete len:221 (+) Transcript_5188:982-1644(+)